MSKATNSSGDGDRLITLFSAIVEQLGRALPDNYELALHDLSRLPHSIVAVSGDVTGRSVGDPATDLLLQQAASQRFESRFGYETRLGDGRQLRSSTMIIHDIDDTPVAALCVNADVSTVAQLQSIIAQLTAASASSREPDGPAESATEAFVHDVDELASHLIHRAIQGIGIPVELMQKQHKMEVVRDLQSRGLFMLKDAVQLIAGELQVTRFTIYNYLNQIAEEDPGTERTGDHDGDTERTVNP